MNLENLGVQETRAQEAMKIEGGSWFIRNWWKIRLNDSLRSWSV